MKINPTICSLNMRRPVEQKAQSKRNAVQEPCDFWVERKLIDEIFAGTSIIQEGITMKFKLSSKIEWKSDRSMD